MSWSWQSAGPPMRYHSSGLPPHSLFSVEPSVWTWRKKGRQDGGRSSGAWAANAVSYGTGEGRRGSLGESYPGAWRVGERGERERGFKTLNCQSLIFLVLDSAIRKCFPMLSRLVSAYIHYSLLLILMASTLTLKPFVSCIDYVFASEIHPV